MGIDSYPNGSGQLCFGPTRALSSSPAITAPWATIRKCLSEQPSLLQVGQRGALSAGAGVGWPWWRDERRRGRDTILAVSYDLSFWKGASSANADIAYERLCDGQEVEGVDPVDATSVLAACREAFASWSSVAANIWIFQPDSDGNGPAFYLQVDPYMVTFSCYGLEGEQMNQIIDLMNDLGFPLYDPQTRERFAV